MAQYRQQVYIKCLDKANEQIKKYKEKLASIRESMDSLDRHNDYDEEGKLLGEYEKYNEYLDNAQRTKEVLRGIDYDKYTEHVQVGSLIETEKIYYFVAAALGEVRLDDGTLIYVISKEAPIFEKLKGKKKGDIFTLKDDEVEILNVH